jgi:hypothetical protein
MGAFKSLPLLIILFPKLCYGNVLSLDLCSDQWILWAIKSQYISGVTYLAKKPKMSLHAKQAKEIPAHAGDPEKISHLKTTYVIADSYIHPFKKQILEKLNFKLIILPPLQKPADFHHRLEILKSKLPSYYFKENLSIPSSSQEDQEALILSYDGTLEGQKGHGSILLQMMQFQNTAPHIKSLKNCNEYILMSQTPIIFMPQSSHKNSSYLRTILKKRGKKVCVYPQSLGLCPGPWAKKKIDAFKNQCLKKRMQQ